MHHIKLSIEASRATTRSPEDFDEMDYIEQIRGDIERVLKARQFFKIDISVKAERG